MLATEMVLGETPSRTKNAETCRAYWLFRAEIGRLSLVKFFIGHLPVPSPSDLSNLDVQMPPCPKYQFVELKQDHDPSLFGLTKVASK